MAPEILQGGKVSLFSDIWSFGCILYEMYTKESLFKSRNYVRLKVLFGTKNTYIQSRDY